MATLTTGLITEMQMETKIMESQTVTPMETKMKVTTTVMPTETKTMEIPMVTKMVT